MATTTKLKESPFLKEGEAFTKDKLLEFIRNREKFSAKAYYDIDHYSIGYGTQASGPDEVISKKEAEQRLLKEVDYHEKIVRKFAKDNGYDWNESQVNSLTDFHYNTKVENWDKLTGKGTRTNDEIAEKLLEYNEVGGKHNQGIQNRRWQNHLAFTTPTETNSFPNYAGVPKEQPPQATTPPVAPIKEQPPVVSKITQVPPTQVAPQPETTQVASNPSIFTNTPPIQVAANTNPNVASDTPTPLTSKLEIPQSIPQQFGYDPTKFRFNQPEQEAPAPTGKSPLDKDFNGNVYNAFVKNNDKKLAKGYFDNISSFVNKGTLPPKEFNGEVYKNLMAYGEKDLAQNYYNSMTSIYAQRPQAQPQGAPTTETPLTEPIKEQSALRVLGQTALKEVIPTGIGFGISEIVGAALAPETGGLSLAVVPLLVNLAARIGTFVAVILTLRDSSILTLRDSSRRRRKARTSSP